MFKVVSPTGQERVVKNIMVISLLWNYVQVRL